ncbi:DUF429 domain-containing protein [Proteobacteria bacterium 005FR1]|nr:DUF429 domain-containing protein [Proteobacteria bacterium 005FR1]
MAILAGADGCKKGWIVATLDTVSEVTTCQYLSAVEDIADSFSELEVLAIDIPIGLPDKGPRACDIAARARLGRPRGSSVFPAPIRPMLSASSHAHASAIGRQMDGRGLTVQCWHILEKIAEVDDFLRTQSSSRTRVREVHPELSFSLLAGHAMRHPKRKSAGRQERLALLKPVFGCIVEEAAAAAPSMGANADDVLDAFVALWSAKRIYAGEEIVLPDDDRQFDSMGLPMEIMA